MHTGKCNELEEGTRHHFQAGLDHCPEERLDGHGCQMLQVA